MKFIIAYILIRLNFNTNGKSKTQICYSLRYLCEEENQD